MEIGKILGIIGIILMFAFMIIALTNMFNGKTVNAAVVKDTDKKNIPDSLAPSNKDFQVAELSFKNYNYFPTVLNFKKDKPARIVVDTNKVKGCFSSIIIPDLGIRKFVRGNDNIIEFIPKKTGIFTFSCPMGMGYGKIIVS